MEKLTFDNVVKITGGTLVGENLETVHFHPSGVSIDSRTLQKGNLFFALRGERFDGHDFAFEALDKGALAIVVSRQWARANLMGRKKKRVAILVDDTLKAFQACAGYYRTLFSLPVVAVTGTNGKTTTKDMVAAVLSQKSRCLQTRGNENNHIGLPLTLFRLRPDHAIAVVELGMRARGEISQLAEICDPHIGLITNVGPAHIQFFRDVEEIARAKGELLDHLGPTDTAILNADDHLVMKQRGRMRGEVITFGFSHKADVRTEAIQTTPTGGMTFDLEDGLRIQLRVPGKHMVSNALAAIAVGEQFDVPRQRMKEALEAFRPQTMRMELVQVGGLRILNDAYNANPDSMRAALETLQDLQCKGKKIAVLGDMLELGEDGPRSHREIGRRVSQADIALLVAVGNLSHFIADEAIRFGLSRQKVHHFTMRDGVLEVLKETVENGDLMLVKGSRKMGLEEIVSGLQTMTFRSEVISSGKK